MDQIQAFLQLDDGALDTLLRLQAAVEEDAKAGGSLGAKLVHLQERARADLASKAAGMSGRTDGSDGNDSGGIGAAAATSPAVAVLSALSSLRFFGGR
jgi:hypothetical protein